MKNIDLIKLESKFNHRYCEFCRKYCSICFKYVCGMKDIKCHQVIETLILYLQEIYSKNVVIHFTLHVSKA